uniref:Uncharacterized protein n=2 Tax=Caudoviricetes TaxID=2731619 RepID=A0AB39C0A4_9CAUD
MGCKVSADQAFGFDSLKRLHIFEGIPRQTRDCMEFQEKGNLNPRQ